MFRRLQRATLGVTLSVGAMAGLCLGFKAAGLALFAGGVYYLERDWRSRHSSFRGSPRERWELALDFYRSTHQNRDNRALHMAGIPLIVGGAVGLFVSPPISAGMGALRIGATGAFAFGWLLNLVGHAAYEKRAPAFSADALSFLAGPVWDVQQLLKRHKSSM